MSKFVLGKRYHPADWIAFWCNFAIAKVTRNPSFYHFVFCVWIKAKNITIARYFSPKCTSYYYIVFYFFSTVSSRCHFPVLCLVARERQFTLRCPRTLFSANNSNFSRVWNELETSIWQHGKLQFEIYGRTIFVVTFDAISIEWIIIGYFFFRDFGIAGNASLVHNNFFFGGPFDRTWTNLQWFSCAIQTNLNIFLRHTHRKQKKIGWMTGFQAKRCAHIMLPNRCAKREINLREWML